MCVCAYVCMYVCMYVCTYVYMCVCVCVCVCMRVLFFLLQYYKLFGTEWPTISFTYLRPFFIYWNVCCFSLYLPDISAATIDVGPSICLMQNNYWPLSGFITGQFCSRLIAMGTPGVGTGCLSWEVRRFLCKLFYSGRHFRIWIRSAWNAIVLRKR